MTSRIVHPVRGRLVAAALVSLALLPACARSNQPPPLFAARAEEIASMSISVEATEREICATSGATYHLQVDAVGKDGQQLSTRRLVGAAPLDIDLFGWTASVGKVVTGLLTIHQNQLQPIEEEIVIHSWLRENDLVDATLTLTPSYRCRAVATFRGATGTPGSYGTGGMPGGAAPVVTASLTQIDSPRHGLLGLARIHPPSGPDQYYFFDPGPNGGLTIDVSGGAGGAGGASANGPYPVYGSYTPPIVTSGGAGGAGGSVALYFDERYPELATAVLVFNGGGPGGAGTGSVGSTGAAGPPPQRLPMPPQTLFAAEIAAGLPVHGIDRSASAASPGADATTPTPDLAPPP